MVRAELMEELVVEVNVNMSVELQSSLTFIATGLCAVKLLEIELVPHVDLTVQLMTLLLFLVHWYLATSLEHTGPGPTSCED